MHRYLQLFNEDSLFRNSFYLMLATGVMAGFGFFFWLISARLVAPEDIGIATTLISVMNIISIFSLIGFDSALVRFLAHSSRKNEKLNTSMILVGTVAIILGGVFVIFVKEISPQLSFIHDHFLMSIGFVVFCGMSAVNILTDAAFLAYRSTRSSFIINTIFSFIKMLLPLAFVSWGAYGIFAAAALGQSIGFVLSICLLIWKFEYRPAFVIDIDIVKQVWKYCTGNYIAGALNLLPITLLPLIITNHIGLKDAAYFYIVMMIGNLLYTIPHATTRSLFAEGSYNESSIRENVLRTTKITAFLLLPSILVLLTTGKFVLSFFGESYSKEGLIFLYLIALSGIVVSTYSLSNAIFRLRRDLKALIIINIFYATTIISLSYALFPLGLVGIGIAWFAGNLSASIVGYLLYLLMRRNSIL